MRGTIGIDSAAIPPDALTELALHCESKQRRLEAIADHLSGYESLKKAPSTFRTEAEHYRAFGRILRGVQARRRPAVRPRRAASLAPGEFGTDATIERSFRDVMRMRMRDRDRELIRQGYRRLIAAVRSARGFGGKGASPSIDSADALTR